MMNIAKLDLNLLVVLEAIYSAGGVTRAAEKLNLSQPSLLGRIAGEAPGIDLRALQVARRNIEAGLASATLDLALDVPLPLSDSVHRERVAADPLVVVARKRHPRLPAGFDLATYLGQQHVMVTSRRKGPGLEDLVLSQHGLQRRIRLRCRNYLAAF